MKDDNGLDITLYKLLLLEKTATEEEIVKII